MTPVKRRQGVATTAAGVRAVPDVCTREASQRPGTNGSQEMRTSKLETE